MNWHKRLLIKVAAAKSKIQRYNIVNPSLKFFIHKYENTIPWADVDAAKQKGDNPEKVISNFISSVLIPNLRKKIDPAFKDNNYLKRYDVKGEYDAAVAAHRANPEHAIDPNLEAVYRVYQRDPVGAEQIILKGVNSDKALSFNGWWDYLHKEDSYKNDPAFLYSILKPMIDSSPETQKNGPPPLNAEALSQIWDQIVNQGVNQMNVFKKYKKTAASVDKKGSVVVEAADGEWVRIDSKKRDPKNFPANVEKLKRFSASNGWCTGWGLAQPYLEQGDFYMLVRDNNAKVAIRMVGNKVQEIRGHHNKFDKLAPYWQEVIDFFLKSNLDYKDNSQYKKIEEIHLLNSNLEYGTPNYNRVIEKLRENHKTYLRLNDQNRKKFPEFLEIAKDGYRLELEEYLHSMEAPRITESQYFSAFEQFQEYLNEIPEDVKGQLGDLQPRIFEAHRKAYHNNPYLFSDFPPEIQQQFPPEEQKQAWEEYVEDDPYHYNDTRMPPEIKKMLEVDLKAIWIEMIKKNPLHLDYMPRKILESFQPGEIEQYALQDFASFPVSEVKGRLDKLERVETLMGLGLVNRQQIVDIFKRTLQQHPDWVHRIPDRYKEEVFEGKKMTEMGSIVRDKVMHIMREPGYFRTMPGDMQNSVLQQYGADIGQAFANEVSKYRGMLQNFWVSVPENVRPYLPTKIRDATAVFYANILNKNPSDFDTVFGKIPPDIQGDVWAKLASRMSWYKKAQSEEEIRDHFERILGLGKYKPDPSQFKKKDKPRELQHSMDVNEDEDDDGW